MILVTGGSGLVGSHLLLELTRAGEKLRALKRSTTNLDITRLVFSHYAGERAEELFAGIEWIDGDVLDVPSLETALDGVDHVYHLAAMISFLPSDRKTMMKVNVEGTANMVNLSLAARVKKLCYVSSIASLGTSKDGELIDEETEIILEGRNSMYGLSKNLGELEIWRAMEEGLDAVVINPSIILGLADPDKGSTLMFSAVYKGLLFYTDGVCGFVDVRDVVNVMVQLMKSGKKNERYIVSAENLSYKEVLDLIAENFNKPAPRFRANGLFGEIAWRAYKLRSLVTNYPPAITKHTTRTAMQKLFYSNKKVKDALGYEFLDIRQTIEDNCRYFLKYHHKNEK